MYLTSSETKSMLAVLQALNSDDDMDVRRASVNMSDANLRRYEEYFQYRDPITRPMQRMRLRVDR